MPTNLPQTGDANWGVTLNNYIKTTHLDDTTAESAKLKTDLATIVAGGKVGIGTSTPNAALDVRGNIVQGTVDPSLITGATGIYVENDGGDQKNTFRMDAYNNTLSLCAQSTPGATVGAGIDFRTSPASTSTNFAIAPVRMTINPEGNVGIGTGNPTSPLQIAVPLADGTLSNLYVGGGHLGKNARLIAPKGLELQGSGSGYQLFLHPLGGVGFGTDKPQYQVEMRGGLNIQGKDDSTGLPMYGTCSQNSILLMGANNGTPAGIAGDAYIGVQRGDGAALFISKPAGYVNGLLQEYFVAGAGVGNISTNGTSVSYSTTSDRRLKENFVPLTGSINKLNTIKVYNYNFINDKNKTVVDGVVAQELQSILPNAVSGKMDEVDADGKIMAMTVDYSKIVPTLIGAVQELKAELDALKKQLGK